MRKRRLFTKESREKKVVELIEKGMNIRQIAKRVHMSFGDIGQIRRRYSGDGNIAQNTKKFSKHSQALELFRTNHSNLEVAIQVGLTDLETEHEQKQFRQLINMDKFCEFYDTMKGDLEYHLQLYSELCNANMTIFNAIEGLRYARSIAAMKFEYANLQNKLKQTRFESFEVWKSLQVMKQEKHQLSSQLDSLRLMSNNGTYLPEPNSAISFLRARRRK